MRDDKETMIRFLLYVQGTGLKIFSASVGFVYFFFICFLKLEVYLCLEKVRCSLCCHQYVCDI